MNKTPFLSNFDTSGDIPVQQQAVDHLGEQFINIAAANKRNILDGSNLVQTVGGIETSPRGAKNIIWSSEGYADPRGFTVPALTTNQKKATGSANTSLALATSTGVASTAVNSAFTLPTLLDFSAYKSITLMLNLSAITGTSIQFELDFVDDSGTPVVLPIWKPAALTAAASVLVMIGTGVAFAQAAAAPSTAAAGFGAIAAPSGWTYYSYPFPLVPNGNFQWTVTAVTADAWTAWIYGNN